MITREDLDRAFSEQRDMTDHAIDAGPGYESYMANLGLDFNDMMDWCMDYTLGNTLQQGRDWDNDEVLLVASLLSRALSVGLILGRETKP